MSINDYCLFATEACDKISNAFCEIETEMSWPEFCEKARIEFNRELNRWKDDEGMLEFDAIVHGKEYNG